jgi:nitric oxide dioxygenase
MLSSQSRPVIEATLQVVGEHIQKIAARFYERLFTAHPSLLDGTFNRGNQHDGRSSRRSPGLWRPSQPAW